MSKTPKGKEAFLAYYQTAFGEKWPELLRALETDTRPILRFRPQDEAWLKEQWEAHGYTWTPLPWYAQAVGWPVQAAPKTPLPGFYERKIFAMNASSLVPVLALDPQPGESVLDACAAPGGKAMAISDAMNNVGELVANDISSFRRNRMAQLFAAYHHDHIQVEGRDARLLASSYPERFDKILVDAPCSSEKHVYNSPEHLKFWSPRRIWDLKEREYTLVRSLTDALKPGGTLVYSTCALTPEENEEVVSHILATPDNILRLNEWKSPAPAEPGWRWEKATSLDPQSVTRLWPNDMFDPMFVAVFRKEK